MNIRFLTLAQKEVDESVRWYDEQAGLGRDFLAQQFTAGNESARIGSP